MALNIKYQKVFGVPVAPDAISQGAVSLASPPVITGDFVTTINIQLRTYTFDLRGINEAKAQEIIDICNTNAESLALGQIDLSNPAGAGMFTYRSAKCVPFSYQDGGTIQVGGNSNNYNSFQVTCLTDVTTASI
ncbi:hypothetical protein [Chroococcidiopsis sp.]|uniref:hypothetical protein n=1 Tax=Chroococcidiopsis sp. TaxID=3088168 RepID=UPI003F3EBCF5